ncbi:FAD-binding oxidoreductase [bacterium]|nr:FAD-binding oxidoreductase [bacterium]|tara:strand:+ start:3310 stop:4953 length:1644 start_codon:yes stop_codon:yes gene_type:complete
MLFNDLKNLVKGEVRDDEETLEEFSHDTSLFGVRPKVVVSPEDVEDVKTLVRYISEHKDSDSSLSLTARSGGTDMSGGPLNESIVLDFIPHFNHFSVDSESLCAEIEPGVFYRDFEKETGPKGVLMPSYPASKSIAALGGMVMNNAGGEKTLRYGQTRKFVEEVRMVLRDGNEYSFGSLEAEELERKLQQDDFEGEVYQGVHKLLEEHYKLVQSAQPKTSKNSAGYALWDVWDKESGRFDLSQLFVGSQGTLGIMTGAKLRLIKEKKHKILMPVFLSSWDELPEIVQAVLPHDPESLELFDIETLKLGLRFMPEVAKKAGSSFIPFALKFLPEVWVGIRLMGLPKLVVLVHLAEDSESEVRSKAAKVDALVRRFHVCARTIYSEEEAEKYWIMRRESFNLLRQHVKGKRTAPFIDDFCIFPKDVPEFLPKLLKILKEHKIAVNIAGHAGDGNFHIIPLMDLTKEEEQAKIWVVADKVYALVLQYGGTITAEHNDGLIRSPYLEKMYGKEVYALFEEVKRIFDPEGIFNPGKKVGSSKKYAMRHLKQE